MTATEWRVKVIHRAVVETRFGRFALEASDKGLRSITPLDERPATSVGHEERRRIERESAAAATAGGDAAAASVATTSAATASAATASGGGSPMASGTPSPDSLVPRSEPDDAAPAALRTAAMALTAYCAGDPSPYAGALDLAGTDFQLRVWRRLLAIPFGAQVTYGAIASELGGPYDARAVGAAVGTNPVTILIPCHRVVGAGGKLTGYAWGLDMKRRLLAHELRIG